MGYKDVEAVERWLRWGIGLEEIHRVKARARGMAGDELRVPRL
jgi:hypothetical protein